MYGPVCLMIRRISCIPESAGSTDRIESDVTNALETQLDDGFKLPEHPVLQLDALRRIVCRIVCRIDGTRVPGGAVIYVVDIPLMA